MALTCPGCGRLLDPVSQACAVCDPSLPGGDDVTRMAAPASQSAPGAASTSGSTSGWLSSSGAIDHGASTQVPCSAAATESSAGSAKAAWGRSSSPTT